MYAAENGHSECLTLLIQNYVNIDTKDNDGYTALFFAADKGHADCLKILIENKANLDLLDNNGFSALIIAAGTGHSDCLNILIENKANTETLDKYGKTALIHAINNIKPDCLKILIQNFVPQNNDGWTAFIIAAQMGYSECIKLLFEIESKLFNHYKSIEELFTSKFCFALNHKLISLTNYKQGKELELDFVNYEHLTNSRLKTILSNHSMGEKFNNYCQYLNKLVIHILIYYEKLKDLPSYSKSLSKENQDQILNLKQSVPQSVLTKYSLFTPFSNSPTDELLECLTFSLLDIKIDIQFIHFKNTIDKDNIQELELLIRYVFNINIQYEGNNNKTPLMYAAQYGHEACLLKLIESGANIESLNSIRSTALMYAAQNGHSECLLKLIENGANIDSQNNSGWTPLMYAAQNGKLDCTKILIQNKANIDTQDNDGMTALMLAANKGHESCIESLIKSGAKLDLKDSKGRSALYIAIFHGYQNCINLLNKS